MTDYAYEIAYLTRQLDQMDARDPSIEPGAHSAYPVKSFADERLRVRAYYLESCLTALASPDMLIGLRAAFQAFAYSGQDWGQALTASPVSRRARLSDRDSQSLRVLDALPVHPRSQVRRATSPIAVKPRH